RLVVRRVRRRRLDFHRLLNMLHMRLAPRLHRMGRAGRDLLVPMLLLLLHFLVVGDIARVRHLRLPLIASFTSPTAFCVLPSACFTRPLACSSRSPVTWPAVSWALPSASLPRPFA